ncbi:MAG: nucleotide exchange factor GrpE [Rhodospirillaceae bacterium]|nr:nucleotide exchange factor GrpE [Rhodospirillaceae bacterium]|tara:strand:+ start:812 stop:1447 length:636 start_codon:yes stop_codon:yes gene_type:complete
MINSKDSKDNKIDSKDEKEKNEDHLPIDADNIDKSEIDKDHVESSEDQKDELLKEISDLKDQLLRSMAEVENIRKRSRKELEDTNKYAITGFARDILSISDNLRRALESIDNDEGKDKSESFKNLIEGVELTERELLSVFNRYGISQINPIGERFDVKFHQAMYEEETNDKEAGTIIQVMQSGYVIQDRLLRPAMVGVAKKPKEDDTNNEN